ncbi:MAG: hypothetical protein KA354_07575 [Phycisphaerae bacterium]|nr:hypothetical protein [Phycisphaerae bacterium]
MFADADIPPAAPKSQDSVVISFEEFTRLLALMQTMTSTIVELYVWMATAGQRVDTDRR